MKWTEMLLLSLVTAAGVLGLGHLASQWSARPAEAAAERSDGMFGRGAWRGERQGHHGWSRLCGDPAALDDALGYVKTEMRLSAAQAPEWDRFAAAVREASERLRGACATDINAASDAASALAAAEAQLAAGLEWLGIVRPAYAALHTQLDARQRALLDTRFRRGHGHR